MALDRTLAELAERQIVSVSELEDLHVEVAIAFPVIRAALVRLSRETVRT